VGACASGDASGTRWPEGSCGGGAGCARWRPGRNAVATCVNDPASTEGRGPERSPSWPCTQQTRRLLDRGGRVQKSYGADASGIGKVPRPSRSRHALLDALRILAIKRFAQKPHSLQQLQYRRMKGQRQPRLFAASCVTQMCSIHRVTGPVTSPTSALEMHACTQRPGSRPGGTGSSAPRAQGPMSRTPPRPTHPRAGVSEHPGTLYTRELAARGGPGPPAALPPARMHARGAQKLAAALCVRFLFQPTMRPSLDS
jgi:hypothetical protein